MAARPAELYRDDEGWLDIDPAQTVRTTKESGAIVDILFYRSGH